MAHKLKDTMELVNARKGAAGVPKADAEGIETDGDEAMFRRMFVGLDVDVEDWHEYVSRMLHTLASSDAAEVGVPMGETKACILMEVATCRALIMEAFMLGAMHRERVHGEDAR